MKHLVIDSEQHDDQQQRAEIVDPAGYAKRWGFSKRKVSGLLAQGLPHLKIGSRRVRIFISEADAWMRTQFASQRRR
jgi:hypothetical protein